MSKFRRTIRSSRFKTILTFVLLTILSISVIGIGVKLNNMSNTKELPAYSFQRGYIDETGICKIDDLTKSVYSDIISVDGLEIKVEKNDVKFQLNFYDENGNFLGVSEEMTQDYKASADDTIPENAKLVRLEIMPLNGDVITLGNYLVYAGHLEIIYNK